MPLTNPKALPGFLIYFTETEAKLAFAIAQAMIAGGIGGGGGESGTQRTTSYVVSTTSGTITAGATNVAIANNGAMDGTLKGALFPAGASITFTTDGANTLDAIAYNATGTQYLIAEIR